MFSRYGLRTFEISYAWLVNAGVWEQLESEKEQRRVMGGARRSRDRAWKGHVENARRAEDQRGAQSIRSLTRGRARPGEPATSAGRLRVAKRGCNGESKEAGE